MKSCNEFIIRRYCLVLVALAIIALMASCFEDDCDRVCDGSADDVLRGSPDSLLDFLADAYEGEDIDAYGEALSDYFEFEFTEDIADSLGLPGDAPWWGREEDIQSTSNMFDDPEVADIQMTLQRLTVDPVWADCGRWFVRGDPPESTYITGLHEVFEPDIKVTVADSQEPIIFWVHRWSLLDIMVTPDPTSEGEWVVLRIKETLKPGYSVGLTQTTFGEPCVPKPRASTLPSTWGSIKAMFKK
jgi:hypothetical protein